MRKDIEKLIKTLKKSWFVGKKIKAARALAKFASGGIAYDEIIDVLISSANDKNKKLREIIIDILADLSTPKTIEALGKILANDKVVLLGNIKVASEEALFKMKSIVLIDRHKSRDMLISII